MTLPAKGTSMGDVKKKYGEPRDRKPAVGGDTPKHPPITRWDYDSFIVIFEKDRVIDAVVPGAPPKLRNTSGLMPAPDAPPPPVAPTTELPAEPIIPEAPAAEPPPPVEPAAEAAPAMPESSPPAETPPPAEPPVEKMSPEPVPSPPPEQTQDGPPTPK
jgi:hypothetical protein